LPSATTLPSPQKAATRNVYDNLQGRITDRSNPWWPGMMEGGAYREIEREKEEAILF
jgi:hypothetical protein